MANTLSLSIAPLPFSGFRVYRLLRDTGASGGSSPTCMAFGQLSPLPLLRHRLTTTLAPPAAYKRWRNRSPSTTTRPEKASKKPVLQPQSEKPLQVDEDDSDSDNMDEDAFEALFSMLEEDLKNDKDLDADDADDEITEEDLNKFEKELDEVLDEVDNLDSEDDEDEEEERSMPKIRNWQLRRLAAALKQGRRKTGIKNLAAELGLDRAVVLELLREPPPDLLLMSASLPDKKVEIPPPPVETESQVVEIEPPRASESQVVEVDEPKKSPVPVYIMQSQWSSRKRLKKVQVETLERVYNRTKRPTNTMISSIVHLTNLPWKAVVKWFEDKRTHDGIPESRQPYHRS